MVDQDHLTEGEKKPEGQPALEGFAAVSPAVTSLGGDGEQLAVASRLPGGQAAEGSSPPTRLAQQDTGQLNEILQAKPTKRSDPEAPPVTRVDRPDLERVRELFVASPDYRRKCERGGADQDQRVWIVHGPQHAGKLTMAVRLALALEDSRATVKNALPAIFNYRRPRNDVKPLIDFMRSEQLTAGTYLIEDAFDRNIDLQELASLALDGLDRVLRDKRSYLILTTELKAKDLEVSSAEKISAELVDLGKVFEGHLDRFGKHIERVDVREPVLAKARGHWQELQHLLRHPVQIERFCHKLGELQRTEVTVEDLVRVAEEAAYIGQRTVQEAFRELNENERLYAMLALLFDGLERVMLEEIYDFAVQSLREAGVSALHEPLQDGLDDILERIRARESAHQIEFEDEDFRAEVTRQIKNYRRLLWKLSEVLLPLCEKWNAADDWQLRRSLGAAFGRLGVYERRRLEPLQKVLVPLALHKDGAVVAVAGYMLDQVCRDAQELQVEVVEVLEDWVTSEHPDLMWAAAASVWRIYGSIASAQTGASEEPGTGRPEALLNRLLEVIETLVRRAGQFDAEKVDDASREDQDFWEQEHWRCAFHALISLATIHSRSLVIRLSTWLQVDGELALRRLAQLVSRRLFQEHGTADAPPIETREGEWLQLILPILATAPDDAGAGDAVMAALAAWLSWPGWKDRILGELLQAANRSTGRAGEALRRGLARHWLTSDADDVRQLGGDLIIRSYAMDGLPDRCRRGGLGVVALDGSLAAMRWSSTVVIALQLQRVLRSYSDLAMVRMGGAEILPEIGKPLEMSDLVSSYPRPRLLATPVTNGTAGREAVSFVVALACGPVLDWDDALDETWAGHLILATTGPGAEYPDTVKPLKVVPGALDEVVGAVVATLETTGTAVGSLAGLQASSQLDRWVAELDELAGLTGRGDFARRIIATVLDDSGIDFESCAARVRGWLSAPGGGLVQRTGAAVTRALCRFYAQRQPPLALRARVSLLELALLLAEPEWSAAEAALTAALCWMADDDWAARLAGGAPLGDTLMSWLETWIARRREPLRDLIRAWRRRSEAEKASVPAAALQLVERIEFRVALGTGEALPELEPDHLYGVILLDASFRQREKRSALAKLAGELLALAGTARLQSTPLLLFRMGRRLPLAVPGEKPDQDAFLPPDLGRLPRLIGPVLELLKEKQVRFVLLLTTGPILDAGDWISEAWSAKTYVFGPPYRSNQPEPFTRIPPPSGQGEAELIARHLTQKGV
jgi:hypothetical protein